MNEDAEIGGWSQRVLLENHPTLSKVHGWKAKVCILVMGIGYLFPIGALWAAFDYWSELFPTHNVEFDVNLVFYLGSLVTVIALCFVEQFNFGPRIYGGYLGQMLCLAGASCFRWLHVSNSVLLVILLTVVLLCSVATGYLDSALLSLCSQYSSQMQAYLQIGIGVGFLLSMVYRDATKLLIPGHVEDASTIYFMWGLFTLLLCILAYRILSGLQIKDTKDQETYGSTDRQSPGPISSPNLPLVSKIWRNEVTIFANFALTTFCHPGLITAIPCRQMRSLEHDQWFQTILLTVYTVCDVIARCGTEFRFGLNYRNIYWTAILRLITVPFMLFCAFSVLSSDVFAFLVVAIAGFQNGYCASLCLIVVNEIPELTAEQLKHCGRISACSVNAGLAAGSVAISIVSARFKL